MIPPPPESSSPKVHLTLLERQKRLAEAYKYKKQLNNPKSTDFANEGLSNMVKGLEVHFQKYKSQIEEGRFVNTFAEPGWKEAAVKLTALEVPYIPEAGTESGKFPEYSSIANKRILYDGKDPNVKVDGSGEVKFEDPELQFMQDRTRSRQTKSYQEVRAQLERENPVLVRSSVLRNASGRYTLDSKVEHKDTKSRTASASTLGLTKVWSLQDLTVDSFSSTTVSLSGDTAPHARSTDKTVRVLLVESNFKHQIETEKMFRKHGIQWDLAINGKTASEFLLKASSKGAMGVRDCVYGGAGYGIIIIDASLSAEDVQQIRSSAMSGTSSGSGCAKRVVAAMHHGGTVRRSEREHKEGGEGGSMSSSPSACPHTGIISPTTTALLLGGAASEAIMKTVKLAAIEKLESKWREINRNKNDATESTKTRRTG